MMKALTEMRKRFNRPAIRTRLNGATGAIDLASIMVGVLVIGIIGGVISATVFAVIPWSQDEAAKGSLDAVRTSQSVAKVQSGKFLDLAGLTTGAKPLLQATPKVAIGTDVDGTCYISLAKSDSGNLFFGTSKGPDVTELTDSTPASATSWCADVSVLVAELGGLPSGGPADPGAETPLSCVPTDVWAFSDPDVKQQVIDSIVNHWEWPGGPAPDPLLVSDASLVKELYIDGSTADISSLNGIQCAGPYAEAIDVSNVDSVDLSSVSTFTAATYVAINDSTVVSNLNLTGLTSAEQVYFTQNTVTANVFFGDYAAATELRITGNTVTGNISTGELPALENMYVTFNAINGVMDVGTSAVNTANQGFYITDNSGSWEAVFEGHKAPDGISIYDNPGLTKASVTNTGAVGYIDFGNNPQLADLTVSNITGSFDLYVNGSALTQPKIDALIAANPSATVYQ